MRNRYLAACLIGAGLPVYLLGASHLSDLPLRSEQDTLRVVLPAPIQTLLALGDRYLAANAYVLRAATFSALSTDQLSFEVQGKVQTQASMLNPYNEDNGMLAAATLSWQGQLPVAQQVLSRATAFRDWDPMPPFFQGFNEYYFNDDPVTAGMLTATAAGRATGDQKLGLQNIASKWLAHAQEPSMAITVIVAMLESTNDYNQRRLLTARVQRLQGLSDLRQAAAAYRRQTGLRLQKLQTLVDESYIEAIPGDPFKRGYVVDALGTPQFNRSPQSQVQGG